MIKYGFGCMVNDVERLKRNLLYSRGFPVDKIIIANGKEEGVNASKLLNRLITRMEEMGGEVGIFLHEDVILPPFWTERCVELLHDLPDNWMIAGVWGIDEEGYYHGNVHDGRLGTMAQRTEPLPAKVLALDELCLIIKLNKGFSFDERMEGWDLYGTYACLKAKDLGYSSWAIDNCLYHNATRPFGFTPDENFKTNWKKMMKFGSPIHSTVIASEAEEGLCN